MDVPSVLAVVVVRDGAAWIRRTLSSLARQTHSRFGVLAVDNASTDGSHAILEQLLGPKRVVRLPRDHGFPGAVRHAMGLEAAREADFLMLLHDDTALEPDAVARLVEEAQRVQGVGVVGPKVLDWDAPRVLREIGFAADRLGYAHTPLEPGEIDQGQYDAPREVLFVSSAAMLIAREAWMRTGPPDERLGPCHADLEFCWRMRLGGYRVLVAPKARAYHRRAGARSERPRPHPVRERYHADRSALAALLTNERILTLLWVLPVFAVFGIARLVGSVFTRRFDLAAQALAAWGWNLLHLPGTIRRRARAQAVRRVRDHEITRFMTPAGSRIEGWLRQGSALLTGGRAAAVEEGEEPEVEPLGRRVASVLVAHPVAVALVIGIPVLVLGFRGVLFASHLEGGALAAPAAGPGDYLREFVAPWRSTAFGGAASASPALLFLGAGSLLTFGDPGLLFRLLITATPLLAGASMHLALRRVAHPPAAAAAGATAYALCALTLWTASEGRIPELVMLVALPWLWSRLMAAFGPDAPRRTLAWIVGTGIGVAIAASFHPPVLLGAALLFVPLLLVPEAGGRRLRGAGLTLGSAAAAAALAFPFTWALIRAGGAGAIAPGRPDFAALLRLSPGAAPGDGLAGFFLPVAALLSFALVHGRHARSGGRALVVALAAVPLAWSAAAGYLPEPVASPAAYLAAAAVSMATLVAGAAAALVSAARRSAFGARQLVVGGLGVVLATGVAAQALAIVPGGWAVGESRVPPAWAVVAADPEPRFRVLWLGEDHGEPFPPPAGDPDGEVAAGGVRVVYAVTGPGGWSSLRTARPASGRAFDALEEVLSAVLSGRIRHGGAALAPFGIRYVVAEPGGLAPAAAARLGSQVDLDVVQREGGLVLYRSAVPLSFAALVPGEAALAAARRDDVLAPAALPVGSSLPLRRTGAGWASTAPAPEPGVVLVSEEFDELWQVSGGAGPQDPFPAFGWALGFSVDAGSPQIRPESLGWTVQLVAFALVWVAALWTVRRRPEAAPPRELRAYPATSPRRARASTA